jgi:hypothetical protein
MFLLAVGDLVKVNKTGKEYLEGAVGKLFDLSTEFEIVEVRVSGECEDNNPECTCNKYITVKKNMVLIRSFQWDELDIVLIKEARQE